MSEKIEVSDAMKSLIETELAYFVQSYRILLTETIAAASCAVNDTPAIQKLESASAQIREKDGDDHPSLPFINYAIEYLSEPQTPEEPIDA